MADRNMEPKNVLYVSYDGMTDPLGQSQVIPYISGLAQLGYRFTLISTEKKMAYEKSGTIVGKILADAGIDWQPIFYTKSPPVLSTLYDYYLIRKKAKRTCLDKNINLVHCRSYIPAMAGLWLKRKYDIKFIFDMRGFWADERVDGKLWDLGNPIYKFIYRFFKRKESELLENADYTVTLTQKAKDEIHGWKQLSNNPVKITTIPCCVDAILFDPQNTQTDIPQLRSQLGIEEKDFILSYLGSIGTWYMLSEMLDFFVALKSHLPSSKFLFITLDDHAQIFSLAAEKGLQKEDIILQRAARNEVPSLLRLSNYSIFFILPVYSKMASSPTKQGEIMAMGIPVICNAGIGDTDSIIARFQAGIVVEEFDFKNAISEILNGKKADPAKLRAAAMDYFSLTHGIDEYASIYKSVLTI